MFTSFVIAVKPTPVTYNPEIPRREAYRLYDIHLEVGSRVFPAEPWRDFGLILVSSWLENYLKASADGDRVDNSFMQGPYYFGLTISKDTALLELFERTVSGGDEKLMVHSLPEAAYRKALLGAARQIAGHDLNIRGGDEDLRGLATVARKVQSLG